MTLILIAGWFALILTSYLAIEGVLRLSGKI